MNVARAAAACGVTRKTAGVWRERGAELSAALQQTPEPLHGRALERHLIASVQDQPRAGAPPRYTAEQQGSITALAVRKPSEFGRPIENWTHRELAEEASASGIAPGISARTVGRFLDEADIQPHRSKYWENPKIDDAAAFAREVNAVCEIYRLAIERSAHGIHTVCLDAKTGIQAPACPPSHQHVGHCC
jgi:transposase